MTASTTRESYTLQLVSPEMLRLSPIVTDGVVSARDHLPEDLVESVATRGVLIPVIARRDAFGDLVIIDGRRRVIAARTIGLDHIPTFVEGDGGARPQAIASIVSTATQCRGLGEINEALAPEGFELIDRRGGESR